jgi:hypothetical protein
MWLLADTGVGVLTAYETCRSCWVSALQGWRHGVRSRSRGASTVAKSFGLGRGTSGGDTEAV